VYSTLLGGNDYDQAEAFTVDASGNAIITGYTASTDFPLKNPISSGAATFEDGFVTSLSADGASLNFSSRLGGTGADGQSSLTFPGALVADASGNVYVSGITESSYLPVTPGALHAIVPSYSHSGVFLTKLQPSGSLVYSAILGDPGQASQGVGPTGMAVDAEGNAYLAGTAGPIVGTTTVPWPITPGTYQSPPTAPPGAAPFVAKVSPDGATLLYSTLVGTGHATGMVLTPSREVIMVGAAGLNYPITPNAFSSTYGASFLAKLSADASQLLYSSYFSTATGGSAPMIANIQSVALDTAGDVWVTGTAYTSTLPVVHPLQSLPGDSGGPIVSAFVSEFDPQIHTLLFSTYFNGAQADSLISGVALDAQGRAHIAGTGASDMPTTSSAFLPAVTPPPAGSSYNYGFAALIDPAQPGPGICFSPNTFTFAQVGSSSPALLTITNCGTVPLSINSVQLSSPVFSLPSGNNCVGSLSENASCTVTVNFAPTVVGAATATLILNSSALILTYNLPVSGYGTAASLGGATATLSTKTVAFGTQQVGAASSPQQITLTNTGTALLSPLAIAISGADAANFSQTNNCGASVASGGSCTINVVFTPSTADAKQASLLLTDNAADSQQTVALSGSGVAAAGILISAPAGASSATVQSGQPATYTVALSSTGGFSGPVSLSCLNLPLYAGCSFSPASVAVSSASTSSVSLTISTQQKSPSVAELIHTSGPMLGLAAMLILPSAIRRRRQIFGGLKRTQLLLLLFLIAALSGAAVLTGCGGGSAKTPTQAASLSTPAGNYTISVVATSGTTSQSFAVSLVVE
jgi:hypothetical protein